MSGPSLGDVLRLLAAGKLPETNEPGEDWPEALESLVGYLCEVQALALALSQGDLQPRITTSRGPVIGSLKALQASLRHLTWQTKQVAAGDYSQRTDFLGEFSGAFNAMVEQLQARKDLELQMHQTHKMEAVGHLASGIAHEINTPLQIVNDNLAFIRDSVLELLQLCGRYRRAIAKFGADEDAAALFAEAETAGTESDIEFMEKEIPEASENALAGIVRVSNLIRDLKEFAQPEQKEKTLADINQALQTVARVSRTLYAPIAEVRLDLGDIPRLNCHIAEMGQVFLGLLLNSTQAIAAKKRENSFAGLIQVRTRLRGEKVLVEYEDNGCGISAGNLRKVFDPFFSTRPVGQGMGLGLAAAWNIVVDKHRGEISFSSREGAGTTFTILLPVK